jgi:hypothetical protein
VHMAAERPLHHSSLIVSERASESRTIKKSLSIEHAAPCHAKSAPRATNVARSCLAHGRPASNGPACRRRLDAPVQNHVFGYLVVAGSLTPRRGLYIDCMIL